MNNVNYHILTLYWRIQHVVKTCYLDSVTNTRMSIKRKLSYRSIEYMSHKLCRSFFYLIHTCIGIGTIY